MTGGWFLSFFLTHYCCWIHNLSHSTFWPFIVLTVCLTIGGDFPAMWVGLNMGYKFYYDMPYMPPKLLFHGEHDDFILMKRRRFGGTNLMLNQFIIPQMMENHMNSILVGGLEHVFFFFPPYIVNNDPNRLSHFSEGWLNHQPALISPNSGGPWQEALHLLRSFPENVTVPWAFLTQPMMNHHFSG